MNVPILEQSTHDVTKPLKLKHPKHVHTDTISRPVLQSTTNIAVQAMAAPPKSILKHRAPMPNTVSAQSALAGSAVTSQIGPGPRPLNAPKVLTHVSDTKRSIGHANTSQSGSSSSIANDSSSTDGVRTLSHGLNFPLPPNTLSSIPSSASTKTSFADRDRRRSMASVSSRKSGMFGGSASGALANMGDLMMQGFGDSDISGEETTDGEDVILTATARRVVVLSNTGQGGLGDKNGISSSTSRPRLPPLPQPSMTAVPSIMVTATSVDSFKSLNRRLSRGNTAKDVFGGHALAPSQSAPNTTRHAQPPRSQFEDSEDDSPRLPSARTYHSRPDTIEWPSLSQMAMGRAQPDYRSATYSIYNMYQDILPDDGPMTPPTPQTPPSPSSKMRYTYQEERDISDYRAPKTPKTTTMSTIYSGYGIGSNSKADEDDIGASFAREVGVSLGRIGAV